MLDVFSSLFQTLAPLLEMSVTAAYAAAIVIVLRLLLKKRAPRQVLCLLWLVVFVRLLIPVSLESPLSIVPDALPRQEQHVSLPNQPGAQSPALPIQSQNPAQNTVQNQPNGGTAIPVVDTPAVPTLSLPEGVTPSPLRPEAPAPNLWRAVLAGVWLAGAAALALYALVSYLRLRRRLFDAIRAKDGAWEHPNLRSPFILGILRPRIYLPAGLAGQPRQFILCHERAHLRRLDHIVKPVCWAALALHWFNPMVWVAYILMSRDIEAACDEAVIRRLGPKVKADYSATLLALATNRRVPAPCPLAFDEGDAKGRIKNVLRYRRPALWIVVVSVLAAVLAAVCLLTDPVAAKGPDADPGAAPSPGASASQPPDTSLNALLDPWMKEVLDGERTFHSSQGEYNIHQLNTFFYGEPVNTTVEAGRVAILDLDRDGVNEMVVWPENEDEYLYSVEGYAILHREGDLVYGCNLGYRAFGSLKADGTFYWASSAFEWGVGILSFSGTECTSSNVSWCVGGEDERCYVDGREATREEFDAAMDAQNAKPEPIWYTYDGDELQSYLPAGAELAAQSEEGGIKLWLEKDQLPWLEWNGSTIRIGRSITQDQSPAIYCRDFDGDGQDEVAVVYNFIGFPELDLYEWGQGQPNLSAAYDAQQILLRFNQNNVAAYSKNTRGFSVTYAHTEGNPDSEDYYRHYVTGSCTLPEDFFDYRENIRDGSLHAYANDFQEISFNPDNSIQLKLRFYPSDDAFLERDRIDDPWALESERDDSFFPEQHYISQPVGTAAFTLRYDGAEWVLREPDQLDMSEAVRDEPTPMDIATAAPLSAPVLGWNSVLPEDPQEWYKVAELPDDLIWVFSRNCGQETLIRWDGNFYKAFPHVAHTTHLDMPQLKKLGDSDHYGPLAVISNVNSGAGCFGQELVVYGLDSTDPVDYTHDWTPLAEAFNNSFSYRYDNSTRVLTLTYRGQTMTKTLIEGPDNWLDDSSLSLSITGEQVRYSFDEANDGCFQLSLGVQAFVGGNMTPLFPCSVTWTVQFNGGGFDVVPGSCVLS